MGSPRVLSAKSAGFGQVVVSSWRIAGGLLQEACPHPLDQWQAGIGGRALDGGLLLAGAPKADRHVATLFFGQGWSASFHFILCSLKKELGNSCRPIYCSLVNQSHPEPNM